MKNDGHIELDWALDAIRVGSRARHELGDIDELVESIRQKGFLQPITIAPDGLLILGWRRYEAARRLGLRTVSVWVRPGLSDRLQILLAAQDDEALRKALTPTESAALYREIKQIMAEEAARRQEATRFGGTGSDAEDSGAANLAAPRGDARAQAAHLVTGANSYTTLERVGEVERIAHDDSLPASVRQLAFTALDEMDTDGKVNGHYRQVKDALDEAKTAQMERLAQEALARIRREAKSTTRPRAVAPRQAGEPPARQYTVRAFVVTWTEMTGWETHYDPAVIGPALSSEQWELFEHTVAATLAFADAAREARADCGTGGAGRTAS